ncbi:hypothetical protein ACIQF6_28095 [Kitasatospora sp. NPDC092948]|uniref:hypothetical protein n=1 Tax=Kitasatospora sp. NPDC092948 TaxID=3364088 RepID=UPI00382B62A6
MNGSEQQGLPPEEQSASGEQSAIEEQPASADREVRRHNSRPRPERSPRKWGRVLDTIVKVVTITAKLAAVLKVILDLM